MLYEDGSKVDYEYDAFQQKIGRKESYPDPRQQPALLEAERVTDITYGDPVSPEEALTEDPVLLEDQMYYLNDGLTIMKEYGADLEPIAQYYEANGQVLSRKSYRNNGWNVLDEESPIKQSEAPVRGMLRGDFTYYLNDHLGSVTHLTDRNGETLEQYRYDAFGGLMTPMTAEYNTIGYTGQTVDPKTGLMDYKARWYDSNAGRFTSADTYEGSAQSPLTLNLYSYVNNNPVNLTDPTGNFCVSIDGRYSQPGECSSPDSIYLGKDSNFMGRQVIWKEQAIGYLSKSEDGVTLYGKKCFSNYWTRYKEDYSYVRWLAGDNDYFYSLSNETQEILKTRAKKDYVSGQIAAGFPDFVDGVLWGAELATLGRLKAGKLLKACNCFTAGTKVLTDEGEKPIEEIEVGDKVLAKSDETGEVAYKEVVGLFQKQTDEIYKVYIGDEVIEATAEHPFWLDGKGWTEVKDLKVGDLLVTSGGATLAIDKIKKEPREATVYNFEVADFHSYFVSNLGIWVHNCDLTKWNKGSFDKVEDSAEYHFKKHGASVGAETLEQYVRKAEEFARTAKKGSTKSSVSGAVEGTIRYKKNGKYVDIAPDGTIVSFGKT